MPSNIDQNPATDPIEITAGTLLGECIFNTTEQGAWSEIGKGAGIMKMIIREQGPPKFAKGSRGQLKILKKKKNS